MSAKQKIVHGHGPTNQNLGNFVCACDVCQAHNHSPLVTLSMQIPLLLLIDDVMCLKLEIHTWPSYLKSPVLSLYIARQLLRRWIAHSTDASVKREILRYIFFCFYKTRSLYVIEIIFPKKHYCGLKT